VNGFAQDLLRVRLDRVIERQEDVAARAFRPLVLDVEHAAAWILDDGLLPGMPGERPVELELEAGETVAVDPDVPEHLGGDRSLRIAALLLRIEAEAGQLEPLQGRGLRRVRLPLDVDEATRAIGKHRVDAVGVEPERTLHRDRRRARVHDLFGVRVDGRRALPEAELDPAAVVDRPAARGQRDGLPMLRLAQARQGFGAHALQPAGA
jgi:hypothetical protein